MENYYIGHSWILTTLYVREVFIAFNKKYLFYYTCIYKGS